MLFNITHSLWCDCVLQGSSCCLLKQRYKYIIISCVNQTFTSTLSFPHTHSCQLKLKLLFQIKKTDVLERTCFCLL